MLLKETWRFTKYIILSVRDIICATLNLKYQPSPRRAPSKISRWAVSISIKHISGPKKIDCDRNGLIALCLVKNGEKFIKPFVEHYNKLGVKHIVFLDNNSTDKTIPFAQRYKNVTVFQSKLPFRTYAWAFNPYLINRFGRNCWSLTVDIDEFFDYPFSDKIKLGSFLEYLSRKSYNAVVAQMLDMFSDKPLSTSQYHPRESGDLKNNFQFYDISNIRKKKLLGKNFISNHKIKFHLGGIRSTIFGLHEINLTKYPLIYLDKTLSADDCRTHYIVKNARLADFSCVLFHYKLTSDLYGSCKTAIAEKNYYANSIQYKKCFAILKNNPDINIKEKANNPTEFTDLRELIKNKFLCVSDDFVKWVKSQKKEL